MAKIGKIILNNDYSQSLLYYPKTKDELKKAQFSWAGEDYRPATVDASIEGAVSKQEEYMPFLFRHISATIVGAWSWKATEFSESVLKAAADKLRHKPVYVNHEMEISNIVGVNGDVKFVPKGKATDGTEVPAGLEAPIWVDARLHKDLCRKLTGYPVPHIQSVSVTVTYKWEPSHEFTNRDGVADDWEFEMKIGTVVDGTMVRRIVTEIIDFYETSFVFLGADPFAKILDENGKPFNIEKDGIVGAKMFDKDPMAGIYKSHSLIFINENKNSVNLKRTYEDCFKFTGKLHFKKEENSLEMEKAIVALLASKLGKQESEIMPEFLEKFDVISKDEVTRLKKAETDLATEKLAKEKAEGDLTIAKNSLAKYSEIIKEDEIETMQSEVELSKVVSMAKYGKGIMTAKIDECIKLYKISVGAENASEAVVNTITNADVETLDGFMKQYQSSAYETYSGSCKKCGSKEFEFRSTKPEDVDVENDSQTSRMAERQRK